MLVWCDCVPQLVIVTNSKKAMIKRPITVALSLLVRIGLGCCDTVTLEREVNDGLCQVRRRDAIHGGAKCIRVCREQAVTVTDFDVHTATNIIVEDGQEILKR